MANRDSIKLCACGCGKPAPPFIKGHRRAANGGSLAINIAGRRFGRLIAIRRNGNNKRGLALWLCRCDCGNEATVSGSNLVRNCTKSCGCLHVDAARRLNTTHGQTDTPTYVAWCGMRQRCYYPKNDFYVRYGGRGITVCARWRNSFANFFADMGERPKGTSLDRIDNDGNYEPTNCRWATRIQQSRNRSNAVWIEHNGIRMTLPAWSERLQIPSKTLYDRYYAGDEPPRLFRPVDPIRKAAGSHKRPPSTSKSASVR